MNVKNTIPNIIKRLNLYVDSYGLLRVKNKCERLKNINLYGRCNFPILLANDSELSILIIRDKHKKMFHASIYSVLSEIRKDFWIPAIFSTVKKDWNDCVTCKIFNKKPINLNQSPYRDLRICSSHIPSRLYWAFHRKVYEYEYESVDIDSHLYAIEGC